MSGTGLRAGGRSTRARRDVSAALDDQPQFTCPHCSKNFTRIENLTRHTAIHAITKKFQCSTCLKRFSRSDLLNRHRKIHESNDTATPTVQVAEAPPESLSSITPEAVAQPHSEARQFPSGRNDGVLQQQPTENGTNFQGIQSQYELSVSEPTYSVRHPGFSTHLNVAHFQEDLSSALPLQDPPNSLNQYEDIWGGFKAFDGGDIFNTGSYDADIVWAFDFVNSDLAMDLSYAAIGTPSVGDMSEFSSHRDINRHPEQGDLELEPHSYAEPVEHEDEPDEEVRSGWPDSSSRRTSPKPPQRRFGALSGNIWNSTAEEFRKWKPNSAMRTPVPHITVDANTRELQLQMLDLEGSGWRAETGVSDDIFPNTDVLSYFIQLYFRHVHPRFSFIHVPTFNIATNPPLLSLAMILTGSNYSKASRGRFNTLFYEPIRMRIMDKHLREHNSQFLRIVDNVFAVFLLCLAGAWSSNRHSYEFAEGSRGILVTACRRLRLLDCRPAASSTPLSTTRLQRPTLEETWASWIGMEKRKRLGLIVYLYDSQYPALFNNQPYLSKAETINSVFPCASEYWEAHNAEAWKMMIGPADIPPSTYYLHALNSCLLRRWVEPPPPILRLDNSGKIVVIYSILTHIFEWRQAVSMCNPTSLGGSFKNSVHNIPEGLRDRQKWCADALDCFQECYSSPDTITAVSLLHQFGYVLLNVSLSDLHLAAGRSGRVEDGDMAEQTLRYWANGKSAQKTLEHVLKMLNIAYEALEKGTDHNSSFEIAVCLFTGGLVCWAYNKLCDKPPMPEQNLGEQVKKARRALMGMGTWRICAMFGVTLKEFESTTLP